MLGRGSMYADVCRQQGFIGAGFDINQDLTNSLPENWRDFNQQFIPIFLEVNPSKSKIAAGLSCGALWTITKGIQIGDIVLSPNGQKRYFVGEVTGDYRFVADSDQPHQRPVTWYEQLLDKSDMSQSLRNSAGSIGTVSNVSKYRDELEKLIKGESVIPSLISQDPTVEDATVFALEKHLEDFLVANWSSTPLGKTHDLYETEESSGQQYPIDTGPIDLLAIRPQAPRKAKTSIAGTSAKVRKTVSPLGCRAPSVWRAATAW